MLNRLLIKYARRGLKVCASSAAIRSCSGAAAKRRSRWRAAGIAFEVVPGVSSAVAAPALAGIPVTHRGLASSFAVITGHHEATYGPLLDGLPPGALTLVVLMGARPARAHRGAAAGARLAAGDAGRVIVGAATAAGWRWTGTLAALGAVEHPGRVGAARRACW